MAPSHKQSGGGNDGRSRPREGGAPRFIAIAGNIGAGKSTLTSFLELRYGVQPFYEPNDANPYLTDFYADMQRFAFHSQMYFLSAKFRAHLELARLLDAHPGAVFVQDRTIYEDAEIFAGTLASTGVMSPRDHATYDAMYRAIRDTLPRPDLLIYLRCSVAGVRRRIRKRGRREELDVDPAYLRSLHQAYEAWFDAYDLGPKMVIETERLDYLRDMVDQLALQTRLESVLGPVRTRSRDAATQSSQPHSVAIVATIEGDP
jgi:deoxyadenosine/deoxycytidine kinase